MDNLIFIVITCGVVLVALLLIGTILSRLYHRATKEVSFVRTGMGGERVVKDGGCMVLPILQEVIPVNMNTLRLEVRRANDQALITRNRSTSRPSFMCGLRPPRITSPRRRKPWASAPWRWIS